MPAQQRPIGFIEDERRLLGPWALQKDHGRGCEVRIALFSLGNLAVHSACRAALRATELVELCRFLVWTCKSEDMVCKRPGPRHTAFNLKA